MRYKFLTLLIVLGCCAKHGNAGKAIPVFADMGKDDSVKMAITYLFDELGRAGFSEHTILPLSMYTGSGFLIAKRSAIPAAIVKIPAKLSISGPEGIYINSTSSGAVLTGNTSLALQEAVYIYLEKLGFRYFMPGEDWTIIPKLKNVFIPYSKLTSPNYEYRSISLGYGFNNSAKLQNEYYNWYRANLMGGAFQVGMGHVYDMIVNTNRPLFQEHPEWFAGDVKKGEIPYGPKFNVGNKQLINFVVEYGLKKAESNRSIGYPDLMLSMDPSDGGGFCEKPECLRIGGPSEQTFYLANAVARKVRERYPNLWVGCGAYSQYILPPKFDIESNIFVMLTTAFNPSIYSTDELIGLWTKKASKVGIYEFLSFYDWDFDVPGRSNISKIAYMQSSIKNWHSRGVRSFVGESTLGYISRGLGHYITAKLLWNVHVNVDSAKDEFFGMLFKESAPFIKKLHSAWEINPYSMPAENDLASWIELVDQAAGAAKEEMVKKRIVYYKAYLHYLALYAALQRNPTREKMNEILNYCWRNFNKPSFSALPAMVSLPNYAGFTGMGLWQSENQTWKSGSQDMSEKEIQDLFASDKRYYKKKDILSSFVTPKSFKSITQVAGKQFETSLHTYINTTKFIVEITKRSNDNKVVLESGYASTLTGKVEVIIKRFGDGNGKVLMQYSQTEKNKTEYFPLATLDKGLYEVTIRDPNKAFKIEFSGSCNFCVEASSASPINTNTVWGYNVFYFYVPPKVKVFEIFKQGSFYLQSPSGRLLDYSNSGIEVINVELQNNETGLWKIYKQFGKISLNGVPPYLGTDPGKMILPVY